MDCELEFKTEVHSYKMMLTVIIALQLRMGLLVISHPIVENELSLGLANNYLHPCIAETNSSILLSLSYPFPLIFPVCL